MTKMECPTISEDIKWVRGMVPHLPGLGNCLGSRVYTKQTLSRHRKDGDQKVSPRPKGESKAVVCERVHVGEC